jgi:hypothetical protein
MYPLLIACIGAALYLFFYRNAWSDDFNTKTIPNAFSHIRKMVLQI